MSLEAVSLANIYSYPPLSVFQGLGTRYFQELSRGAKWAVGSLGIIGNPAGLVRNVSVGVRDLFERPYTGAQRGFGGLVTGLGEGTASFLKHVSSGALFSISTFASSVGRNMERLSMDENHVQ